MGFIAGNKIVVNKGGAATNYGAPKTCGYAIANTSNRSYRDNDWTDRVWDATCAITVTVAGGAPATPYTIDRLLCQINFLGTVTAPLTNVKVQTYYRPLAAMGEGHEFTITAQNSTSDVGKFGDTWARKIMAIREAAVSISDWDTENQTWTWLSIGATPGALDDGNDPQVVELRHGAVSTDITMRMWAIPESEERSSAVSDPVDLSLDLTGARDADGRIISFAV